MLRLFIVYRLIFEHEVDDNNKEMEQKQLFRESLEWLLRNSLAAAVAADRGGE